MYLLKKLSDTARLSDTVFEKRYFKRVKKLRESSRIKTNDARCLFFVFLGNIYTV